MSLETENVDFGKFVCDHCIPEVALRFAEMYCNLYESNGSDDYAQKADCIMSTLATSGW